MKVYVIQADWYHGEHVANELICVCATEKSAQEMINKLKLVTKLHNGSASKIPPNEVPEELVSAFKLFESGHWWDGEDVQFVATPMEVVEE